MKNLRAVIYENRKSFLEQNAMSAYDLEVQDLIGNLDQVVVAYEARWGAMRLPEIISAPMKEKWDRQFDKLCGAIEKNDLTALRDLVPGTVRAYSAMESDAIAGGHKTYDPVFWEVSLPNSGQVVRVVKNNADAAMVAKEGVETWTLEEIARVIAIKQFNPIRETKRLFPGAELAAFDFNKGDSLPF